MPAFILQQVFLSTRLLSHLLVNTHPNLEVVAVPLGIFVCLPLKQAHRLNDFYLPGCSQFELERKLQSAESRAVMAEEQLENLQKYIAQASVTYQREIVRLRSGLQKADPTGAVLRSIPAQPPA